MDIRKLQRAIVDGLEDTKAQNIRVFNTEHLSALFERVIVASGTSNRQTKALAASVRDSVKSRGMQVLRTEGEANGEWIIVDCGAAVAHIMQPSIRDYYHLEEIWGDKPVNMKLDSTVKGLVKAAEAKPAGKMVGAKAAPSKPAPSKPAPSKPAVKKAAPRTPAPKKMTLAKRTAAGKAPAKKGVSRTVGVKKALANVARKPAAKAPAKKAAGKATPARRSR
jgi:ribosome-associated protein